MTSTATSKPLPSTPSPLLDRYMRDAVHHGLKTRTLPDGTVEVMIGRNASHTWTVVIEPGGLVFIEVEDEEERREILIRGDADVPSYIGHY